MSQGGISYSDVVSIVDSRVGPVARQVDALTSVVSNLNGRVQELEDELSRLGNALDRMSDRLASKLEQVNSSQKSLIEAQMTTHKMTHEQFRQANEQLVDLERVNVAGFTATQLGLTNVNGSVTQMMTATAQMEVIKTINDAREPLEKLKGFSAEIDERFGKAVENVFMVRGQYDQLLSTQMSEYDKKLRLIGEHIYTIYEQDFRERAEIPLMQPARSSVELPLSVDELRLGQRESALEGCLLEVSNTGLGPLLEVQQQLENQIASKYAASETARVGEAAIPIDLCIYESGSNRSTEVIAGARVEPIQGPGASPSAPRFKLVDRSEGLRQQLESHGGRLERMTRLRALDAREREALVAELQKMVDAGELAAEMLEGYLDYLDAYGLEIAEGSAR